MQERKTKCKYCDLGFEIVRGKPDDPDNDDYGIAILRPDTLCAYGYDVHGSGSNAICVTIKFCPMCGKKL